MILSCDEPPRAGVTFPHGFEAAAARAGLKTTGDDVAVIQCAEGTAVAGVFTTNQVQAPCVGWSRSVAEGGTARAVAINAGNANTCNGPQGAADNRAIAEEAARLLSLDAGEVLVASTGIIGHPMPMELLRAGIGAAAPRLARGIAADEGVASAIMTTDTYPKACAMEARSDQWAGAVRLGGMCKGAGMIAPNMATMLAFLTTDAAIAPELLSRALKAAVAQSFNCVTVDGDTSTNDMCILLASGRGEAAISSEQALADFTDALTRLATQLARKIAGDGEGATKVVEVTIKGARSYSDARTIGHTVAQSPLVKTALFGNDPNWGRILMAVGRAGVPLDPDRIDAWIGEQQVCRCGAASPFDADRAHKYLEEKLVQIVVDLNDGPTEVTTLSCDFSYEYVRINADYHT